MYVRLDLIQPRTEEWIKKSWLAGRWSPNAVINSDGQLIDARLKGGLRPSPVTRDLTWGVPVPDIEGDDNQEMKGKVLCECEFLAVRNVRYRLLMRTSRRLGMRFYLCF